MSGVCEIRLEAASFSLPGGRDYNEDFLGEGEATGALRLFVLADGAGGHGGGDVASRTAVQAAVATFRELQAFSADTVRRCIGQAHQAVIDLQKTQPRLARMASTLVLVLINCKAGQALLGNLGDSRCYVFRGKGVTAQSQDHSLVQRFIDAGLFPAERLREHPKRNVLYASLGANEEEVEPHVSEQPISLQAGDGVLLCSDGVWELLQDSELGELHAGSDTVDEWRDRLLAALQACLPMGHDNYSAYVIRCVAALSGGSAGDEQAPQG